MQVYRQKIAIVDEYLAIDRSMTGGVRTTAATVHRAVYRTDGDASVNLCLSQPAWTTTTNRREQNLFLRSGKSEAVVTNNRRLRLTYCTIEANRHEASRGLSASKSKYTIGISWSLFQSSGERIERP